MKIPFPPFIVAATTFALSTTKLTTVDAALRGSNESEQGQRVLSEEVIATFLISDIEMEGHTLDGDERRLRKLPGYSDRKLNIGMDDGTAYEIKNAQNNGWAEGLVSGESKVGLPPGVIIRSDGTVDMGGKAPNPKSNAGGNGNGSPFHRDLEAQTPEQKRNLAELRRNLATTGTKTVLAVRVIVDNGQYGYTEAKLSQDLFDPNGINLKTQYEDCSYNQFIINEATDRNVVSSGGCSSTDCTNIRNGVVTVRVSGTTSEGDGTIRNRVSSKLNSLFAVNSPSRLADHVMYCLPPSTMSGIAYAYINSWNSVYSNVWCNYLSTQMHELGHNFGYAHSNESGTYKDQTGMMGYSYSQFNGPVMCFNGAKSWQTGWYTDKSVTINPTANDGSECFEGNLHGIASYNSGSTVLVKIDDPSGSTSHFVNFNGKTGINSGTVEGGNQVTVTRTGNEGTSYAESELVAKRSAGGTWDATVRSVPMVVTVKSISGSTSANVLIAPQGYTSCNAGTDSPTDSPSKRPTNAPVTPAPTNAPVTSQPTNSPTKRPTSPPVTPQPTPAPVTPQPTSSPTKRPTSAPVTPQPTPAPVTPQPTSACAQYTTGGTCKKSGAGCRWNKGFCV